MNSVSGSSVALKLLETSFHQDLNGDGVIGIPGLIEAQGSNDLEQANNVYTKSIPSLAVLPGQRSKYLGVRHHRRKAVSRLDADRRGSNRERLRSGLEAGRPG